MMEKLRLLSLGGRSCSDKSLSSISSHLQGFCGGWIVGILCVFWGHVFRTRCSAVGVLSRQRGPGGWGQDRVLDQLGRKWKKDYYLPTSMDAAVGALRKWFSDLAPSLPWDAAGPQPPLPEVSRHDLLERFHSHTENCPTCMRVPSPLLCCPSCSPACHLVTCML